MALLSSVGFIACQKDATTPLYSKEGALNVTPRVKAFVERARSSELCKSSGTLSLDSAEWYLEAGLNFSLAQVWLPSTEQTRDTIHLSLPASSDQVLLSDLLNAFELSSGQALEFVPDEEGHMVFFDVVSTLVGEQLDFEIIVATSSGGSKSVSCNYPSGQHFGWTGPMSSCGCGPYNGGSGLCADKKIQACIIGSLPSVPVGTYFTNYEQRGPYSGTNYPQYYWNCVMPNCLECVSPQTLFSYSTLAKQHAQIVKPAGKVLVSAFVQGMFSFCCPERAHEATYTYAIQQSGAGS